MQDVNPQPRLVADEGIGLVELWGAIAGHKAIVMVSIVLSLLVAALYLWITPPIFESRAVIQVGQIQGLPVEAPAALVWRLGERYDKENVELPRISDASLDKKAPGNIVNLQVQDHSAEGAKSYLEQVILEVLAGHKKIYDQTLAVSTRRIQFMEKQLQDLNGYIDFLSAQTEVLRKVNPSQAAILGVEKGRLITERRELETDIFSIQQTMGDFRSSSSKLFRTPVSPKQSHPKSKLILGFALVLGFFLGIVAALIADGMDETRQKIRV